MAHYGRSRHPKPVIIGRAFISTVAVSLTDTPSAKRDYGPDGSVVIGTVLTDTPSAVRQYGPDGTISVAVALDTPGGQRSYGPDGTLVIGNVYTDTPSAVRQYGPDGTAVVNLTVTDTPSAVRQYGPDGVQGSGVVVGPDTPSAARDYGPDGTVSPDLAVTGTPSAQRCYGPDGALAIGIVLPLDSPSATRYYGPSGSVFADVGGGVTLTDTPSVTRYYGPDGALAIGVVVPLDPPSATRYYGPDGALAIGTSLTDAPSATRYYGPSGVPVVLVGATDTPSALRAFGPDGSMGIVVPVTLDPPTASRYYGPSGTVTIGVGADVIVSLGTASATRYYGPDGEVLLAFLPKAQPYVSPAPIYLPGYSLWVADTVTGRMLWELPMATMSWSNTIGSDGSINVTLDIEKTWDSLSEQDERDPRVLVRELLTGPWRFCLVVVYGSQPVWAGPYISMSRPVPAQVQLGGAEIGKIFSKRVVLNPGAIGPTDVTADTVIGPSATKAHAAYVLINQAMIGTGRNLPIIVTDPGGSNIDYRTYYGYDLRKTADALRDLTGEVDGPEIRFDPQIVAGADANYLQWTVAIGNPHLGRGIDPWVFDDDVSVVTTMTTDASNMAMAVWSAGSGDSRDKLVAQVSDTSRLLVGYPMLEEVDTSHSSVDSYPILASQAAAQLAAWKNPAISYKVNIPADRDPLPGTYHVGEDMQITVQDDPVLPDGVYARRIGGISGTQDPWVTLTDLDPLPAGAS